jgi:hypothetical protein
MSFPFHDLPQELQERVLEETVVSTTTKPRINVLEVDFIEGMTFTADTAEWYEPPHAPTLYTASSARGGEGVSNASAYIAARHVSESGPAARRDIEAIERRLRLNPRPDLVELKAKRYRRRAREGQQEEVSVWVDLKKDLLVLQGSRTVDNRWAEGPFNWDDQRRWYYNRVYWFSPHSDRIEEHWNYVGNCSFMAPLTFFQLHRFERLAIDWQTETTRRTIIGGCVHSGCEIAREEYFREVQCVKGTERRWCSKCLGETLDSASAVEQGWWAFKTFLAEGLGFGWIHKQVTQYPADEPGSFTCRQCKQLYPCGEGRGDLIDPVAAGGDFEKMFAVERSILGWTPKCREWHYPDWQGDIVSLFMGRLPALKTFYIVDTSIKLKPGKQPTLPAESFEGNDRRYVEVNLADDAWDLSAHPPYDRQSNPLPFHSIGFARHVEAVAWRYACRLHARRLAFEDEDWEGALDELGVDLQDDPTNPLALNQPFPTDTRIVEDLEYPAFPPESMLPVVAKVLTRLPY